MGTNVVGSIQGRISGRIVSFKLCCRVNALKRCFRDRKREQVISVLSVSYKHELCVGKNVEYLKKLTGTILL